MDKSHVILLYNHACASCCNQFLHLHLHIWVTDEINNLKHCRIAVALAFPPEKMRGPFLMFICQVKLKLHCNFIISKHVNLGLLLRGAESRAQQNTWPDGPGQVGVLKLALLGKLSQSRFH